MLFNSIEFLVFLVLVYGLYVILRHRGQNVLLLVGSYFFYGWWDWRFLSLIWVSTLVDYLVGLALSRASGSGRRRALVTLSIVINLGLLGTFKYFDFFCDSAAVLLTNLGFEPHLPVLAVVLPVGISFYTFQTLSYTIDIYRKQLEPTRNLLDFAVFVAFFPQLVAGPIERARRLLPQIQKPRTITYTMVREGLWLLLLGYFKKVVVADNLSHFARTLFESPDEASSLMVLGGVYAFAFQIYGDFSGYSDIARGLAKLMGIDIMWNFRMPYLARNPSDFWQRWHISLSSWLRDYLYIPLGGNRGSRIATYRNLMLTMLLGGLWHGAAWHFVAWGLYQGLLLCVHRALAPWLERLTPRTPHLKKVWGFFVTVCFFHLTCLGWLFFAVQDLGDVLPLLGALFGPLQVNIEMVLLSIAFFAWPLLVLDLYQERKADMTVVKTWPRGVRAGLYALLFGYVVLYGVPRGMEFIYFQF